MRFLLLFVVIHSAVSWRIESIGRTVWATPLPSSNVLVTTDRHIVALLSETTGKVVWRHVPHSESTILSDAALVNGTFILASYSDALLGIKLNGHVAWRRTPCGRLVAENNGISSAICGMIEHGKSKLWGGEIVADQIQFENGLVSDLDGRLYKGDQWTREDGLAYVSNAIVGELGVVAITERGFLFGIDLESAAVQWKKFVGSECRLVGGVNNTAVVVCLDILMWILFDTGEVASSERGIRQGVRASLTKDCLSVSEKEGRSRSVGEGCKNDQAWVVWEKGGDMVQCVVGGKKLWNLRAPDNETWLDVIVGRGLHWEAGKVRPHGARVLSDRSVLYRYTDGEIIMLISTGGEGITTILVDGKSGIVVDVNRHEGVQIDKVVATKSEDWFIYTFWNQQLMFQELHMIDLDRNFGDVTPLQEKMQRAAISLIGTNLAHYLKLSGKQGIANDACPVDNSSTNPQCGAHMKGGEEWDLPQVQRSSMIVNRRVIGLDVTESEHGVTEPAVVFLLESGQAALVSKMFLDARSSNKTLTRGHFLRYRPLLNLDSASYENRYVAKGDRIDAIIGVAIAPIRGTESACRILLYGLDLLYGVEQPAGSFDQLPEEFSHASVSSVVSILVFGFWYTARLRGRNSLMQAWKD